jgi:hypothetical protein
MFSKAILIDMEPYRNIRNNERLISIFGRWPSFHDAEVVWLRLDRRATALGDGPTVEALIHAFEMTSEVNPAGYYVLQNHVLVHLRFSRVVESILDGFNLQNALNGLSIEDITHRQMERLNFEVTLDAAFGLEASFQCEGVEVVDVEPCDSAGMPASGQMNGKEPSASRHAPPSQQGLQGRPECG